MKTRNILAAIPVCALALACSCNKEQTKEDFSDGIRIVEPTTEYGLESDDVSKLQLTPGKLLPIKNVTATNCARAVKAGMWIDIITSDAVITEGGLSEQEIEQLFINGEEAISQTGADVWGMHLPYQNNDIASVSEATRAEAVSLMNRMIDLSLKSFKPNHFVIHPSSGSKLTTDSGFEQAVQQSQKSLAQVQAYLDERNATYGTNAILCVENCPKSVAYDAESILHLLDYPGLEKTRICLDTGHILIPSNGKYADPVKNGDALAFVRAVGKRLGTLHIQQNPGAEGQSSPLDKHLQPFTGGLIDWGEFYYELLTSAAYRGCFLYETSYTDTYGGSGSTIETVKENYTETILSEYKNYLKTK